MTLYPLVLIIHVSAVFVLSAALTIEVLSVVHLRGASTLAEAHPWINPVPRLPLFAGTSVLVILFSGAYLVIQESAFRQAWPKVAVASVLLMAPLGAMTGRRMSAIRRAYRLEKVTNSELLGRLRDPFLKMSLGIRIAVFLGIFLLVSAKPGLWESISLVCTSVVIGLLSSLLDWSRNASLSVPSSSSPV